LHAENVVKGLPLLHEAVPRLVTELEDWVRAEWTNKNKAAQVGGFEENMLRTFELLVRLNRLDREVGISQPAGEKPRDVPLYHNLVNRLPTINYTRASG
jgi:hypothetical protein